jgi:hypothetical protein
MTSTPSGKKSSRLSLPCNNLNLRTHPLVYALA